MPVETITAGTIMDAIQSRLRQPTAEGIAATAMMRSTRVRTVEGPRAMASLTGRGRTVVANSSRISGVGQPVVDRLDGLDVADDLGELGEPRELPPRERAEPEHRAVERCQQQDAEIAIGDMRAPHGRARPDASAHSSLKIAAAPEWSSRRSQARRHRG